MGTLADGWAANSGRLDTLLYCVRFDPLPAQSCFYTDGVKLSVNGSPVLDERRYLAEKGVELGLCSTCLETYGLREQVAVGVGGGMGDIIAAMTQADNVITA
jgi:hypothetical protein